MAPTIIHQEIEIAAAPTAVWQYVGSAAGLSAWWQVQISMEPTVGGSFCERSMEQTNGYQRHGTVTVYEPPHRLSIVLVENSTSEQPLHTELEITLTGTAEQTTVTIVHRLFDEQPVALERQMIAIPALENRWGGPTMALPGSLPSTIGSAPLTPVVHPDWQAQRNAEWMRRMANLPTLLLATRQEEN